MKKSLLGILALVALPALGGAMLAHAPAAQAAAGPGDELLNAPDSQPQINVPTICFSFLHADVKSKTAVIGYESCDTSSSPPTYQGAIYTITVTVSGSVLQRPFAPAVTTTTVKWAQAASDFSGVPGSAKTFLQRFALLQGT